MDEKNFELDLDTAGSQPVARVMMVEASGFTRSGVPTVTVDCEKPRDFAREIDRLKSELDAIADRAVAALGEANAARSTSTPRAPEPAEEKPRIDSELTVSQVMTRDVRTVERNDVIAVADELMRVGSFRHVVVLNEDRSVAGVVSHRDIVYGALAWTLGQGRDAHDKALRAYPVKNVMAANVVTVDSDTPLREAGNLMLEKKLGCLPVVDGGELVGILTEGDFLYLLAGRE